MLSLAKPRADAYPERGLAGGDGQRSEQLFAISGGLSGAASPLAAVGPDRPGGGAAPLGICHISGRIKAEGIREKLFSEGRNYFEVSAAGRVGQVSQRWHGAVAGGGDRGVISEWSQQSRVRCMRFCLEVEWPPIMAFITLTYPGDAEAQLVATDGLEARRHLKAFRKRLDRLYGRKAVRGLWKQEFQRRGAAHWHLWLGIPTGASFAAFKTAISDAWVGAVGSSSLEHERHGAKVEAWIGNPATYVKSYLRKNPAKEYQHQVPEGYENAGRFWGAWNIKAERETVAIPVETYLRLRRTMAGYERAAGRRKKYRGMSGGFTMTEGSAADFLARATGARRE